MFQFISIGTELGHNQPQLTAQKYGRKSGFKYYLEVEKKTCYRRIIGIKIAVTISQRKVFYINL